MIKKATFKYLVKKASLAKTLKQMSKVVDEGIRKRQSLKSTSGFSDTLPHRQALMDITGEAFKKDPRLKDVAQQTLVARSKGQRLPTYKNKEHRAFSDLVNKGTPIFSPQ